MGDDGGRDQGGMEMDQEEERATEAARQDGPSQGTLPRLTIATC